MVLVSPASHIYTKTGPILVQELTNKPIEVMTYSMDGDICYYQYFPNSDMSIVSRIFLVLTAATPDIRTPASLTQDRGEVVGYIRGNRLLGEMAWYVPEEGKEIKRVTPEGVEFADIITSVEQPTISVDVINLVGLPVGTVIDSFPVKD